MRFKQCLLTCQDAPYVAFRFDVENDLSVDRSLTVSSKANESGFPIAQAAAADPIKLNLSGKIGYLVSGDTLLNAYNEKLDMVQNRLGIVQGSFLGGLVGKQVRTVSKAVSKLQTITKAADNFITKIKREIEGNNRLDEIYAALSMMYDCKMLIEIETPLETIENVLITNLSLNYADKTDQSVNVSITLEEIRFVKLKTANLNKANFATQMCRADIGLSDKVDMGQAAVGEKRG
jgi:hypothetical protein